MKKLLLFLFLAMLGIDAAKSHDWRAFASNAEGSAPVDEVRVTPSPYEPSVGGPPPTETPYDDKAQFKKTDRSDNPYEGADKRPSSE